MNAAFEMKFRNIGLSNELIKEMTEHYQPTFISFIYDVLTYEDVHIMYNKYGKYEMSDSIHELVCSNTAEYPELVNNIIFINRLHKLLLDLEKYNLKIKFDTWRLDAIIEIFNEEFKDLLTETCITRSNESESE